MPTDPPAGSNPDMPRRLRVLLAERGLTIAEAADLAGMSRQQAQKLVKGTNPDPRLSTLRKLVEGAGGTLGELFGD